MSDEKISVHYEGQLIGHTNSVTSIVCGEINNKTVLYSGSRDKTIIQWELNLDAPKEISLTEEEKDFVVGKPLKSLRGHNHFVSSLALSTEGKKLISGSWDKTARIWDLQTMKCQKILSDHAKDVLCVTFSPDERMIFTGSMDQTLKYWNNLGDMKHTETDPKGWVSCLLNIKKGKDHFMAVGSWDSDVRIYNKEYSSYRKIRGNDYGVTSMSVSDEGDYLFVAHKDGTIKVYKLAEDEGKEDVCKQTIETNVDVNAILFDTAYFNIYAIGTAQGLQIREIKGNVLFDYKLKKPCPCNALCYDPSKQYLFAAFTDGTIRVFKINKA